MKLFKPYLVIALCAIASFSMITTPVKAQDSTATVSKGKVFGLVFGDYYYKLGGASHTFSDAQYASESNNANAFDIRRLYLGYSYNFSSKVSAKVLLAHEGNVLPDGNRGVYLKVARVQIHNIIPNGNLVVGQTSTPTFAMFTEKIWAYRSIEKTLLDMRGLGGGVDLGIQMNGNFNKAGTVGYIVMIGNGTGARFENNKFKKMYGEVHARLLNRKLLLEGYADYQGGNNHTGVTTLKGFIGYQVSTFTAGLSVVKQWRKNAIIQGVDSNPAGFSLFVHGVFIKNKLSGFIRYDLYNPDQFSSYDENFEVAGLDYQPYPHIHFMPNVWVNGYAAKANSPTQNADVVGRITFYFTF